MSQQSSSVTGSVSSVRFGSEPRFIDLFALDFEPETPKEPEPVPFCPETTTSVVLVASPSAPVMPKPARMTVKPVIVKLFGCDDLRRIMAAEATKRSKNMPRKEACVAACMFGLRIVMFDYREASNYEALLKQARMAAIDAHEGDEAKAMAWYDETRRELKKQREAKSSKQAFEAAIIVAPAPVVELEPMVPTHLLCRELMAASPANVEAVARRIVGTLKGDDRYAADESARKQLLVDAKARVVAALVTSSISLEEALRRGESVKNAWPLMIKKAAPTKAATSGPARPLTADELNAMLNKDETVKPTAKPASSNGKVRTPEQITLYHDLLKLKRLEEAAEKRERAEAEAKAREAKAAKIAAEARAAEEIKKAKAKAAAEATEKKAVKQNKGKHTR